MKTVAVLVLAGLIGSGVGAAEENPLEAARAVYGRRREALQSARDEMVGKALAVYRRELGTLLANVRPQGNLDYVLAIENETKRLDAGGGAPLEPAAKEFAHLRRIQWAARQTEDKADKDLAEQAAKLRAAYTADLERLERTLVASNRIDEAKAAREEKAAVEGRAICGKWLFVGQFPRTINEDGTINRFHNETEPDGAWTYLGNRQYRIMTNRGERVNTATLAEDESVLEWVASDGKTYQATRR